MQYIGQVKRGENKMEFIIQSALENATTADTEMNNIGHANIKVIGVGGGGGNMVTWLYKKGVKGAEIVAMNTDKQHLDMMSADKKILIGRDLTRGLGAGGYPKKGMEAAKESLSEIKKAVNGSDMTFIITGEGGGTGFGYTWQY